MTEQVPPTQIEERETEQSWAAADDSDSYATTGVAAVDRVLAEVDALDNLPVEEHLGAYERAHESLRSALDAQPSDQPGDPA